MKEHFNLEPLRERLYGIMWDKVGIIRDETGLKSSIAELKDMESELDQASIADANRAFNLT